MKTKLRVLVFRAEAFFINAVIRVTNFLLRIL
jgi:hypothetical protein